MRKEFSNYKPAAVNQEYFKPKPSRAPVAAKFLGQSLSWLYKQTHLKLIPHSKRGKTLFFDLDVLSEWAFANRVLTQDELEQKATDYITNKK